MMRKTIVWLLSMLFVVGCSSLPSWVEIPESELEGDWLVAVGTASTADGKLERARHIAGKNARSSLALQVRASVTSLTRVETQSSGSMQSSETWKSQESYLQRSQQLAQLTLPESKVLTVFHDTKDELMYVRVGMELAAFAQEASSWFDDGPRQVQQFLQEQSRNWRLGQYDTAIQGLALNARRRWSVPDAYVFMQQLRPGQYPIVQSGREMVREWLNGLPNPLESMNVELTKNKSQLRISNVPQSLSALDIRLSPGIAPQITVALENGSAQLDLPQDQLTNAEGQIRVSVSPALSRDESLVVLLSETFERDVWLDSGTVRQGIVSLELEDDSCGSEARKAHQGIVERCALRAGWSIDQRALYTVRSQLGCTEKQIPTALQSVAAEDEVYVELQWEGLLQSSTASRSRTAVQRELHKADSVWWNAVQALEPSVCKLMQY